MKKIIALFFCLLIIAMFFLYWQPLLSYFSSSNSADIQYASESLTELVAEMSEEAIDSLQLAIADIDMEQGTEGKVTWKLKANWATFTQNTGQIDVLKPHIEYYMDNEGEVVYVDGEIGKIRDNNNLVILSNNVTALKDNMMLTSDYGEFRAIENTLTFPLGAYVESDTFTGEAKYVIWDLTTNILHGEKDVSWVFYNSDSLLMGESI